MHCQDGKKEVVLLVVVPRGHIKFLRSFIFHSEPFNEILKKCFSAQGQNVQFCKFKMSYSQLFFHLISGDDGHDIILKSYLTVILNSTF